MPFSESIRSFLTRRQRKPPSPPRRAGEPAYPLGLNQDQVRSLRALDSIPQYKAFTEALQQVCEQEMAVLVSGLPHDQYLTKCGRVQALLDVLTLPDTIDLKAKELDEHQRSATVPDPGKRNLTFFGSPFWSPGKSGHANGSRLESP